MDKECTASISSVVYKVISDVISKITSVDFSDCADTFSTAGNNINESTNVLLANYCCERKETIFDAEASEPDDDVEDVHICGRCKQLFNSLSAYVKHKSARTCSKFKSPNSSLLNKSQVFQQADKSPVKSGDSDLEERKRKGNKQTLEEVLSHLSNGLSNKSALDGANNLFPVGMTLRRRYRVTYDKCDDSDSDPDFEVSRPTIVTKRLNKRKPTQTCRVIHRNKTQTTDAAVRTSSSGKLRTCELCTFSCKTRQELASHVDEQHMDHDLNNGNDVSSCLPPLNCTQCPFVAFSKSGLIAHRATNHAQIECRFCNRKFVSTANMQLHERVCLANPELSEESDGGSSQSLNSKQPRKKGKFAVFAKKRLSVARHSSDVLSSCWDDTTSMLFSNFLRDMCEKQNKSICVNYRCMVCTPSVSFASFTETMDHIHSAHTGVSPAVCCLCGHWFPNYFKVSRHLSALIHRTFESHELERLKSLYRRLHYFVPGWVKLSGRQKFSGHTANVKSRKSGKPYSCEHCRMSYKQLKTLHRHLYEKHDVQAHKTRPTAAHGTHQRRLTRCVACSHTFDSRAELILHSRKVHGCVDINVFVKQCPVCEFLFNSQYVMQEHYLSQHTPHDFSIASVNPAVGLSIFSEGHDPLNLGRSIARELRNTNRSNELLNKSSEEAQRSGDLPDCLSLEDVTEDLLDKIDSHEVPESLRFPYECGICRRRYLTLHQLRVHVCAHRIWVPISLLLELSNTFSLPDAVLRELSFETSENAVGNLKQYMDAASGIMGGSARQLIKQTYNQTANHFTDGRASNLGPLAEQTAPILSNGNLLPSEQLNQVQTSGQICNGEQRSVNASGNSQQKNCISDAASSTETTNLGLNNEIVSVPDPNEGAEKPKHVCTECRPPPLITFGSQVQFVAHMRKAHQCLPVFRCLDENCALIFDDPDYYIQHWQVHDQRSFICHWCNCHFATSERAAYQGHKTNIHRWIKQVEYCCTCCYRRFATKEARDRHLDQSTCQRHICEKCGKVTRSIVELEQHLETHNDGGDGLVMCDQCGALFDNPRALKRHRTRFHRREEDRPKCEVCGATFAANNHLKRHFQTKHTNERPFKCLYPSCHKSFARRDKLHQHMKFHQTDRPYECRLCKEKFNSPDTRRVHEVQKHNIEELRCHLCHHAPFLNSSDITTHLEIAHGIHHRPLDPYHLSCPEENCNQTFTRSSKLARHREAEHGITASWKVRCQFCGEGFTRQDFMLRHVAARHNQPSNSENELPVARRSQPQESLSQLSQTQLNVPLDELNVNDFPLLNEQPSHLVAAIQQKNPVAHLNAVSVPRRKSRQPITATRKRKSLKTSSNAPLPTQVQISSGAATSGLNIQRQQYSPNFMQEHERSLQTLDMSALRIPDLSQSAAVVTTNQRAPTASELASAMVSGGAENFGMTFPPHPDVIVSRAGPPAAHQHHNTNAVPSTTLPISNTQHQQALGNTSTHHASSTMLPPIIPYVLPATGNSSVGMSETDVAYYLHYMPNAPYLTQQHQHH